MKNGSNQQSGPIVTKMATTPGRVKAVGVLHQNINRGGKMGRAGQKPSPKPKIYSPGLIWTNKIRGKLFINKITVVGVARWKDGSFVKASATQPPGAPP